MRLKRNLAAGRLQDPGTLVKQVAAELGFDDPCHFSRAFKSVFGMSPEASRRLTTSRHCAKLDMGVVKRVRRTGQSQ
jgi:AraC-like DNA-binding protein